MTQVHEQEAMLQELRFERANLQQQIKLDEQKNNQQMYYLDK